jgi:hypothetical protein
MPYYPKSQIKDNLYTNGDEFTTSQNQNESPPTYTGYYYELSNGKRFTGKTPQDGPSFQLFPIQSQAYAEAGNFAQENPSSITYNYFLDTTYSNIKNTNLNQVRYLPSYNPTTPTQQDYTTGVFTRYFCKKNNENIYIEITQQTYKELIAKTSTIAWDLYTPELTLWYLTGNKDTVAKANKGLVDNIERTKNWYGFSQYFKNDFLKYYLGS